MNEKLTITKPIIVEGKYDKIKLSSILNATIIIIDGFHIYKDKEKKTLIRRLAMQEGIVLITDSDKAGFQLRSYIRSVVKEGSIINIYIPQVEGKELRKASPSKQGFLGVEGIDADLLRKLFLNAGVLGEPITCSDPITRIDLYNGGYIGAPNSTLKRQILLKHLDLPTYVSTNGLLDIINRLITKQELEEFTTENL